MKKSVLWSLRLGFTSKQAENIDSLGIEEFIKTSLSIPFNNQIPDCLKETPKTIEKIREFKKELETKNEEEKKELKRILFDASDLKKWWIDEIQNQAFPLREKMVLFWHNHYVSTSKKVRVNWWIYQHNSILREHAFGNFRELTKKIIKSNATLIYLDNQNNKKDKLNENLSRELLELFTIGIGNYSEDDIKNGAKALAGLLPNDAEGSYKIKLENKEEISYFNKKGIFKLDDIVNIIFEQEQTPYLIVRKILKWFIYDNPKEKLVQYYGDFFKVVDYEIEPLLIKIFTEEFSKKTAGSKIKNPLEYILQLSNSLEIKTLESSAINFFLNQQGMDLFDQPNVKGWVGGNKWLTSQIYLQRNKVSDLLCNGQTISEKSINNTHKKVAQINVSFIFNMDDNPKEIIKKMSEHCLFESSDELENDFNTLLKYDFDPKSSNAQQVILRLFNFMTKTPEYQLI
jgi:uncharacterized protein (DUF1800 family)